MLIHVGDPAKMGQNPASVDMDTGDITINPVRWRELPEKDKAFIFFHEMGHYQLQTMNEAAADNYAANMMRIYFPELGNQKIFDAGTRSLPLNPVSNARRSILADTLRKDDAARRTLLGYKPNREAHWVGALISAVVSVGTAGLNYANKSNSDWAKGIWSRASYPKKEEYIKRYADKVVSSFLEGVSGESLKDPIVLREVLNFCNPGNSESPRNALFQLWFLMGKDGLFQGDGLKRKTDTAANFWDRDQTEKTQWNDKYIVTPIVQMFLDNNAPIVEELRQMFPNVKNWSRADGPINLAFLNLLKKKYPSDIISDNDFFNLSQGFPNFMSVAAAISSGKGKKTMKENTMAKVFRAPHYMNGTQKAGMRKVAEFVVIGLIITAVVMVVKRKNLLK